jgi:hypothetical protein
LRSFLVFLFLFLVLFGPTGPRADTLPVVRVYKSATCGCCGDWVDHLKASGFRVEATDVDHMGEVKQSLGVTRELASCHTAQVEGYVVEGHVPAREIKRLLRERPPVVGLAVPAMPIGSPGMEGADPERYSVLAFDGAGKTEVFEVYVPDPERPNATKPEAGTESRSSSP